MRFHFHCYSVIRYFYLLWTLFLLFGQWLSWNLWILFVVQFWDWIVEQLNSQETIWTVISVTVNNKSNKFQWIYSSISEVKVIKWRYKRWNRKLIINIKSKKRRIITIKFTQVNCFKMFLEFLLYIHNRTN